MCIPPPSRLRSCLTLADTHRWALNHTRQNPNWRLSTNSETGWTPRSWRPGPRSGRPRKTWYYNQHQLLALEFHIGDKVYLDASDIHTTRPSQKLAHCCLGPFTVTQRVSWNAYRLQLLTSMSQLHPVFNVVKLLQAPEDPILGWKAHLLMSMDADLNMYLILIPPASNTFHFCHHPQPHHSQPYHTQSITYHSSFVINGNSWYRAYSITISIFTIFSRLPSLIHPPLNSVKWSSPQNNSCHRRYSPIRNLSSTMHIFRNKANSPSWW